MRVCICSAHDRHSLTPFHYPIPKPHASFYTRNLSSLTRPPSPTIPSRVPVLRTPFSLLRTRFCSEGKQAPKFDYNSGKFEFKEIVQIPEDLFAVLNRMTAACQKGDVPAASQRKHNVSCCASDLASKSAPRAVYTCLVSRVHVPCAPACAMRPYMSTPLHARAHIGYQRMEGGGTL